jgi:L-alanine-DL-glutamate epimerase-like enolase superfamily enzyme
LDVAAVETAVATTTDPDPLSFLLVRVRGADGLTGYGEACDCYGCFYPGTVRTAIEEVIAPLVVGPSGVHPDALAPTVRASGAIGAPFVAAVSAVEIALWDLLAKRQDIPVVDLFGRRRDSVRLYASNVTLPDGTVDQHLVTLGMPRRHGVTATKVRIIGGRDDVDRLRGLVERLPAGDAVMVDANERYEAWEALALARQLEAAGARWFEEPIPYHQRAGVARLARRVAIPIAYGEHSHSVADVLEHQALVPSGIVQVDASACGGIAEMRRMVAAIGQHGARIVPHNAAGPVAFLANLHAALSIGDIEMMEFPFPLCGSWRLLSPEADALVNGIADGRVQVSDQPGLGATFPDELFDAGVTDLDRVPEPARR